MPFLKSPGCNCCACDFSVAFEEHVTSTPTTFTWSTVHQFWVATILYFNAVVDASYGQGSRLQILADGVGIFDSGCFTANFSGSAWVPANTIEIKVICTANYCGTVVAGFTGAAWCA